MTTEVSSSSGQWHKQESCSVLKDGVVVEKSLMNNVSVRTGEEFSMEFLQCVSARSNGYHNDNGKVVSNGMLCNGTNGNHHLGYEELGAMLGLQRVDYVCGSNMMKCMSANGSFSRQSGPLVDVFVPDLAHRTSGSGVTEDSQRGKFKFICSSGGKILPRPCDGKLRYVGGQTRLVSIQKSFSWLELVKRTNEYCNESYILKYQLPGEDFDSLISVSSDEDLHNMIEEYNGLGIIDGSQRLRIYLIPLIESETTCAIEANADQLQIPDYQYIVAVNGIVDHNLTKNNDSRCLTNETNLLIPSIDENPSFPQKQSPSFDSLHDDFGLNSSNGTPKYSELLSSTMSPDNISLDSLDPVPQMNMMNGHTKGYIDPTYGGIEIPSLNGRAYHSLNLTPQPADPVDIYLGSDANGFHPGMPHAFSDPQLQERGRSSCFDSHNGNTLPPTLNVAPPPAYAQVESSVVLQEKSAEKHENVHSQVVIEIPSVKQPASYHQTDPLKRVHDHANGVDEKLRVAEDDQRINVGLQNSSRENIPTFYQVQSFSDNDSSVIANGDINKVSKGNHDQKCVLHNPQVSDYIVSESVATSLKPGPDAVMQQYVNNHLENHPAEPALNSQKVAENLQYVMTGIENDEQGNIKPWVHHPEKTSADLLSGIYDNISCDSAVGLPNLHLNGINDQKSMLVSSSELQLSAGLDFAGVESPLCFGPSTQNPITGAGIRREVSLMDDDFFNYTEQEISRMGLEENYNKTQKGVSSVKDNLKKQLELPDLLGDAIDVPSSSNMLDAFGTEAPLSIETEVGSTCSDSNEEDVASNNGSKDVTFSNTLIVEMEADMYGLQIIKNAELEELRELGCGTYGTVYHGRWRGSDVAIKRIKKSCFAGRASEEERLTNDFWSEARILSNLHHPNVVAFYGVVPDGDGGTLATVTEFMTNGSLRNVLIKKDRLLDRRRKLILVTDAAFGMEYLHSKNIVHFDLKCDNLLVNMRDPQRPVCKVGDFGLSKIKRNTLVTGGVKGTLPWMAPELLNGSTVRVSEKVDVFSFGITMWEILTGEEPYANMHCGAIIGGIVNDTLRPSIPEQCDPEWRELMEQCWSTDPGIRPSFSEISSRLRTMSKTLQANGVKKGSHA
uniref:uncharacterized protein LOC122594040 n=1 Tax=Erigeron canadensis TaxID=72917 RepID=UPI001CB8B00C|nr:uncharacterized protein LOC122594040 [Erigeron canadensis]